MKNPLLEDLMSNLTEVAKTAADSIGPSAQKASEYLSNAAENLSAAAEKLSELSTETEVGNVDAAAKKPPKKNEPSVKSKVTNNHRKREDDRLSTKSALKVMYFLMAVDGEITGDELEKFDEVGNALDVSFSENKDAIVRECDETYFSRNNYDSEYEYIKHEVSKAIKESVPTEDSFITPKLLLWDLLANANIDDEYSKPEQELIKYIAGLLDVPDDEYLELETSMQTLVAIENELDWLTTTDRPYSEVETMINELADRKLVIMESVRDLLDI